MTFEPVDTKGKQASSPKLTVSPNTPGAYLHEGALREFFDGVDHVTVLVDRDRSLLAFDPGDGEDAYKLSRSQQGGAQIYLAQALARLDVDPDDLEDSHRCDVRQDSESGYVVADVSSLVEATTDGVHCEECGRRFTEKGVKSHYKKVHDEEWAGRIAQEADPDDVGESIPEGDDSWQEQYDGGETA